jgi:citrate synthase
MWKWLIMKRFMNAWRTAIATSDETHIWNHGYDVTSLMTHAGFTDSIFLLHRGRLPTSGERRLLDAILVGVADHGAGAPSCAAARLVASGNRQSFSAAVAAGILAIGDEHGGAGMACMEMIAAGVEFAKRESVSIEKAARRILEDSRANKKRLPGLGHRVHATIDPRTEVLYKMAREVGIAADGVAFMMALQQHACEIIKPISINIDGALAALLYDMGFPAQFGMLVFIIGRVAGISAEVAEEYTREKAMRIRIPVTYDGVPPREIE